MPFNSLSFLLFFVVVFGACKIIADWRMKKLAILIFSQIFYAAWYPPFVLLLLLVTGINWCIALRIACAPTKFWRKFWLFISLTASLTPLAYFKYGYLLQTGVFALLGSYSHRLPATLMLPIGISFYTFHALSYTIDIYRSPASVRASFSDFALYMCFFPQLVSGPIVRAQHFLPQLASVRLPLPGQLGWGLWLFVYGLYQKMVVADTIFAPVVDQLYKDPNNASALDAWAGLMAFSGQIYCDFAGYSGCAIGLAMCLGFHFPANFLAPYGAIGFSDFWRRWHISLSSWLRDYLYYPLGGNRGTVYWNASAVMLTMSIGGLWHGASWLFVMWGVLHGFYLLAERWLRRNAATCSQWFSGNGWAVLTFVLVTLTWIPFRAPDANTAWAVVRALFRWDEPTLSPSVLLITLISSLILFVVHRLRHSAGYTQPYFAQLSWPLQGFAMGGFLLAIFMVSGGEQRGFIYFQF
jgi:D-alanyl-lipoteichoic acid acyltransferase DltB (MBOAT superfamily)